MKKIIFIISFLFVLACSSSDDETDTNNEDGFLTKYEGVVWMESESNDNYSWWYIFSPNGVRAGDDNFGSCFTDFLPWGIEKDGVTHKILSNTSNTLKIDVISINDSYTITINVSGNTATVNFSDEPEEPYVFYKYDSDPPC